MDNITLSIDMNSICRGCMATEDINFEWLSLSENVINFSLCTNLQINTNDGLPANICNKCIRACESWSAFKIQCESSEVMLKSLLINYNIKATEIQLEIEPDITESTLIKDPLLTENNYKIEKNPIVPQEEDNSVGEFGNSTESELDELILIKKTKKRINCKICGKSCVNKDRLVAHYRWHEGLKPEVCQVCNKEFDNARALHRHKVKHEVLKTHICNECGKAYKYANSLRLHKKIHTDVRRYICDFCGKGFVRAHGLQSHLVSHSTETPFHCDICGKQFKSKMMLQNHRIRHEGIKKFICSECGKTFTTSAELVTHSRTHSGIKPFGCSVCDKKYKTKSHLAVHMRYHTGSRPYACDLCPQKFAHNKVLKQHRLTHTGERPHVCNICQRAFRQRSTLQVHMKTHKNLLATKESDGTVTLEQTIPISLQLLDTSNTIQQLQTAISYVSADQNLLELSEA